MFDARHSQVLNLIANHAKTNPDKVALIEGDRRISYAQLVDAVEGAASVDIALIIGRGGGDVEGIAPAAVVIQIDTVQREGYNGQDIGPQGAHLPGGIDLAGGDVLHIVDEGHRHVGSIGPRRSQMDGDVLRDVGDQRTHGQPSYRS